MAITPTMIYTVAVGLLVAYLVQWLKTKQWAGWITDDSAKFTKAITTFGVSLLTACVPVIYTWATKGEAPDWAALGNTAWGLLTTFVVASGWWALLLHKAGVETE